MIARLATIAALLLIASFARAHPWHETVAEVEFNPETKSLEIALRVDALELEAAVGAWAGRRVSLDDTERFEPLCVGYITERFGARSSAGSPPELRWVGIEDNLREVWLYFELAFDEPPREIELACTVLNERNAGQVHGIVYRFGAWRESAVLSAETPSVVLPVGF